MTNNSQSIYRWFRSNGYAIRLDELMRQFYAQVVFQMVDNLSEYATWGQNESTWLNDPLSAQDRAHVKLTLQKVDEMCADLGFRALGRQVKRDIEIAKAKSTTYKQLGDLANNLKQRIGDEYESLLLVWIEDADFFQKDDLFGEQVGERFKGASYDIKEAGNCYALRRYTACVYHLMRVAEAGLKAIGKHVGFPDDRPMWESVLKYIDAELRRDYGKMNELFKGDVEFISGISSQMHALNLACRRRVAHVERTYSPDEAVRIFESTRGLMQHIATKLSEVEENSPSALS
jgi:hypothetical protein